VDAYEFNRTFGAKEAERVALEAGTTLAYFRQIVFGFRFPSRELALRLVEASSGRMTLHDLMYGNHLVEQRRRNGRRRERYKATA
jgi:hypothetical protein